MPFVRISLMKRKPEDFGQKVGKVVYQAIVDTIYGLSGMALRSMRNSKHITWEDLCLICLQAPT